MAGEICAARRGGRRWPRKSKRREEGGREGRSGEYGDSEAGGVASQDKDDGDEGREGKYVWWREERKVGDEGSSGGGEGREVACWRGAGVEEAGMRSGGGVVGGRSGSEGRGRDRIDAGFGGVVESEMSKLTFLGDFF